MNKSFVLSLLASVLLLNTGELLAHRLTAGKVKVQLTAGKVKVQQRQSVAANAKAYCSSKTLKGTYSYAAQGYEAGSPFGESGMETYDGKGNVTGLGSDSSNPDNGSFTGIYTVNSDCTGAVDYGDDIVYNIYVKPDGSAFSFLDRTAGNVLAGEERRISKKLILE